MNIPSEIPKIGDMIKGRDLGLTASHGCFTYIWVECSFCKKGRWIAKCTLKKRKTSLCRLCYEKQLINNNHLKPPTKGSIRNTTGRIVHSSGYLQIWLRKDDFFYSMVNGSGYVFEHRLIMAKALGRCLHKWEMVHHKNHIKQDNRIENLQLISDIGHKQLTILEDRIIKLEKRLTILEAENALLKKELEQSIVTAT